MVRTSAAEWATRVERWRSSGLTAKEFAAKTGIRASTLSHWGWKLAKEGDARGNGGRGRAARATPRAEASRGRATPLAAPFVEVAAVEIARPRAELEILIGERVRVRVPSDVDEAVLARVMRAVGVAR